MKNHKAKAFRLVAAAGAVAALLLAPIGAARAEFPEKPVEMTVLFGSTAKTIAQVLSDEMGKALGKPVVPVFRPGAGGAVGYKHVGSQPADGYSIVWNSNSISTSHLRGNMDLSYKDFAPIARISVESLVVAVKADSPYKTLKDIAAAREEVVVETEGRHRRQRLVHPRHRRRDFRRARYRRQGDLCAARRPRQSSGRAGCRPP